MKFLTLFSACLLPCCLLAAESQHKSMPMASHGAMHAASMQWGPAPPSLPGGAQATILSGDPGKPGSFTIRLKMPAGYRVPRHWHSHDEALTLIEGDFDMSSGPTTSAHSESLAPGDFINMPAHMQHEASSMHGAIVQVQSIGPFDIHYVNAKDDPRKGKMSK